MHCGRSSGDPTALTAIKAVETREIVLRHTPVTRPVVTAAPPWPVTSDEAGPCQDVAVLAVCAVDGDPTDQRDPLAAGQSRARSRAWLGKGRVRARHQGGET